MFLLWWYLSFPSGNMFNLVIFHKNWAPSPWNSMCCAGHMTKEASSDNAGFSAPEMEMSVASYGWTQLVGEANKSRNHCARRSSWYNRVEQDVLMSPFHLYEFIQHIYEQVAIKVGTSKWAPFPFASQLLLESPTWRTLLWKEAIFLSYHARLYLWALLWKWAPLRLTRDLGRWQSRRTASF